MSAYREITRLIPAVDSQDGAGVKLKRSIGRSQHARVDPFLMLDAFSSLNPDDYIAGFPAHPHRGFETVTYMIDGHMTHRDHMGNEGDLKSGGVQWMTAGRGVIHEERPQLTDGLMRGFQLWVNLPSDEKLKPAFYQDIPADQIPTKTLSNGVWLKVIAGDLSFEGEALKGPIAGITVDPLYIDVQIPKGETVEIPLKDGYDSVVYPFEGDLWVVNNESEALVEHHTASVLTDQGTLKLKGGENGGRALVLAGKPLNEPIAQYGPFVMNTMDEVEQAIRDYQAGTLTD
jgi:redox-sensitive bicupin YhaK (pirin superfamily)